MDNMTKEQLDSFLVEQRTKIKNGIIDENLRQILLSIPPENTWIFCANAICYTEFREAFGEDKELVAHYNTVDKELRKKLVQELQDTYLTSEWKNG